MEKTYKSKMDWWVFLALAFSVFVGVRVVFRVLEQGRPAPIMILVLAGFVLPLWLVLDTSYRLTSDTLYVRSGPIRKKIPLKLVRSVEETNEMTGAPALSMDRLRINYGTSEYVLISPKDKREFLRDLKMRTDL